MVRFNAVNYLTPSEYAAVDACIRRHRFCGIRAILAELSESGIKLSKSGLHRYMQAMREKNGPNAVTTDNTMVMIVERDSGTTKTISTSATAAEIVAMIEGANVEA
ncbi:MAG: hypothetical protein FD135_3609 [Comamonadaceae bacterium]|nr:MAG: hypothetical protein FD135_3609 [Comamonadaceae bacterium]